MRALVVATDPPTVVAAVGISLPVLDRSLVQHLVEYVLDQGVQQIDFALPSGFESATRLLGTGLRWGGHFNHYSVPDGSWPIDVLRPVLSASGEEKILIAYADNFFLAPIRVAAAASHNTMFYRPDLCTAGGHPDCRSQPAPQCGLLRGRDRIQSPGTVR